MSAVVIPVILRIIPVMPWSQWRSPGRHVRFGLPAQPVDATLCPRWKDGVYSVISEESRLSVSSKAHLNKVLRRLNERPRKALGIETPAERFNASVASTG
jgi:hypothetical protein